MMSQVQVAAELEVAVAVAAVTSSFVSLTIQEQYFEQKTMSMAQPWLLHSHMVGN